MRLNEKNVTWVPVVEIRDL